MKRRSLALLLALALVCGFSVQALAMYGYDQPGDTNHFTYYAAGYDAAAYPQKTLNAPFTTAQIAVDGVRDAAYDAAPASAIENVKTLANMTYADNQTAAPVKGTLRSVWDGPVLYLLVEVFDETLAANAAAPANGGAMTSKPAVPTDRDSVVFAFDLWNDKVVYETDTTAVFTVDSTGHLTFYRNASIPSLGSVHADPIHPEYTNRIKGYAASATATGYIVELALQIEGTQAQNDRIFGVDVQLCNVQTLAARTVQEPNPWWPWFGTEFNTVTYPAGPGRSSNTFWSHNQDSLYAEYDHERPVAVDWGHVILTGWDGQAPFAFSSWRLTSALAELDSIRFAKGVYTPATQAALDAAVDAARVLIDTGSNDITAVNAAADTLEAAIAGLRWADTKYPDPAELPNQFTLPNPYQFFGSDRTVETFADWDVRRAEILDLAQFYEYGYKPEAPDAQWISAVTYTPANPGSPPWVPASPEGYRITLSMTYGSLTRTLDYNLYMPSATQVAANGHVGRVPVVLSFDGNIAAYQEAGLAVMQVPAGSGGDGRSNEYAWGTRTGVFYDFFPYSRNGEVALKEVSSEMASAWSASRGIDALELLAQYTAPVSGKAVNNLADPEKLAVTGFSINGKYAFVSAVFDERIGVCIPGAAGASGPSPWRYVYAGQKYDWSDTVWAPNGAAQQTAFGTEMMANSVRHNRVRETELFRHFLTPDRFYQKLDGAYGYAARLPYDQNDLVATLAPRAIVLENTLNDYNDGCVADALALDVAKTVYENLGYDADDLVKYNFRTVQPTGDPHGSDTAQRARTAEYLNHYFYETDLSEATDEWLATNPFTLPVSNNKTESPYDYYYGGYNTITGGGSGGGSGGGTGGSGW